MDSKEFQEIRTLVPKFGILVNNGVLSFVMNNDEGKPVVQDFCNEMGNKDLLESMMWNSREIDITLEHGKSFSFIDFIMENSDLINGKFYFCPFKPDKPPEEIYKDIVSSGTGVYDPERDKNLLRCFNGVDFSNADEIAKALREFSLSSSGNTDAVIHSYSYVQHWVFLRKILLRFEQKTGIPVVIQDPVGEYEYGFGEFQLSSCNNPKSIIHADFLDFLRTMVAAASTVSIEAGKIKDESLITFTFFA